ncbi:MAG: 3-phosphoshikimate 1-carboxyvinyltransferase, partial [Akkermansiaceae bacterium]
MSQLKIKPIDKLWAEFAVPGDKSISHRAAILSGLSNGDCRVDNFLPSEDCICTLNAMASVGVSYDVLETKEGYGPTSLLIHGRKMKLTAPSDQVDCGNSGTGMRLLAGMLAAQPFESILTGDASLCSRPMGRIITPLTEMGASIQACGESPGCAPLRIGGGKLRSIHYDMPVASAQVKSAVLLAGLFTEGKTSVTQPAETRDHTERMLEHFRVRSLIDNNKITVYGGQVPESRDVLVPGDISSAAFWIVAAAATPGAHLLIKNVGLNPTRTALLDVLIRMGAQIKDAVRSEDGGEPYGNIEITG